MDHRLNNRLNRRIFRDVKNIIYKYVWRNHIDRVNKEYLNNIICTMNINQLGITYNGGCSSIVYFNFRILRNNIGLYHITTNLLSWNATVSRLALPANYYFSSNIQSNIY